MDYQELIELLRERHLTYVEQVRVANAIESLLAENERLKDELAKYRDAPVVAYLYIYRNCFGDEVWTTDHNWGNRTPLESKPLIVKPEENNDLLP